MATARFQMMIPLFGRMLRHSFVPAGHEAAAARSFSPGRPVGRRASALPWTGASTVAGWRRLRDGDGYCGDCDIDGERSKRRDNSANNAAKWAFNSRLASRPVRRICGRSCAAVCHSGDMDTRGHAGRKWRQSRCSVAQRRHGSDADHA